MLRSIQWSWDVELQDLKWFSSENLPCARMSGWPHQVWIYAGKSDMKSSSLGRIMREYQIVPDRMNIHPVPNINQLWPPGAGMFNNCPVIFLGTQSFGEGDHQRMMRSKCGRMARAVNMVCIGQGSPDTWPTEYFSTGKQNPTVKIHGLVVYRRTAKCDRQW